MPIYLVRAVQWSKKDEIEIEADDEQQAMEKWPTEFIDYVCKVAGVDMNDPEIVRHADYRKKAFRDIPCVARLK